MRNLIGLGIAVFFFFGFIFISAAERKDLTADSGSGDYGGRPWTVDIEELTLGTKVFRAAKWTGNYLQMATMSIPVKGEIGGEVHPHNDQFIRIERGQARVIMKDASGIAVLDKEVSDDWAIFIPAGYWHNLVNTGETEVKLYSIYSPPEHPKGTVHKTYQESEEAEHKH